MARRSRRLRPIHRLAAGRENDAARALGLAQRELAAGREQLRQLTRYREEYVADMTRRGRDGISAARLREYQAFLDQLDAAIRIQCQRLQELEARCHDRRHQWHDRHRDSQVLEKVMARIAREERKAEARKEQRETDDFAGRRVPEDGR